MRVYSPEGAGTTSATPESSQGKGDQEVGTGGVVSVVVVIVDMNLRMELAGRFRWTCETRTLVSGLPADETAAFQMTACEGISGPGNFS